MPERAEELIQKLETGSWGKTRRKAANELGELKESRAVKPLIVALKDRDLEVQESAIKALGNIGDSLALDPLIGILRDNIRLGKVAAEAICQIGDRRVVGPLISFLVYSGCEVKKNAALALNKLDPFWWRSEEAKGQVPTFISALMDENLDFDFRINAAEILGKLKDLRALDPLITSLRDDDRSLKKVAVEALGQLGDPRAMRPLISSIRDWDQDVREGAFSALNQIDPKWPSCAEAIEQIPKFITALQSINRDVQAFSKQTLVRIGKPAVEQLVAQLGSTDTKFRKEVVKVLTEIGVPAVDFFIIALRHRDYAMRKEATIALEAIAPDWPNIEAANRQTPEIIKALMDEDSDIQDRAGWILEKIQSPLLQSFPNIFCSRCLMRGVKKKIWSWSYVICRGCGVPYNLVWNVKEIRGLIGGDILDFKVDRNIAYVSLWSEADKKARNADVDLIEVKKAPGISYEYAFNAILVVLKDDISRPRDYVKKIPVIFSDNPSISENGMRILKSEFGGIIYGD